MPGKSPAIWIPHDIANRDDPIVVFHIANLKQHIMLCWSVASYLFPHQIVY